jgi:1-acyl-sn-glycerol-3-phosphate acyltransferase
VARTRKRAQRRSALPDALAGRLRRSHKRARSGRPWLQGLVILLLVPLLSLLARVRVRGRANVPAGGGFIVAPNHPSVLDAFFAALPILPRRLYFMGMAELWQRPVPAWLMSRLGGFPIIRGTWDGDAFDTAASVLERGRVLVLFPEGGVSPPGGYRPARPGLGHIAHRAGADIVPVHLCGPRRLYRWWSWPRVTVTVGEPIHVEHDPDPSRERSQATADRVLAAIRALDPEACGSLI